METADLIRDLQDPAAYPHPVDSVSVLQTHISLVFLAGDSVYKIKKPVRFEYVDYSGYGERRKFCGEEVRLNRRLAPDVYRGLVDVVLRDGHARIGGEGSPIDTAVHMARLPDEHRFRDRVRRGILGTDRVRAVARRIADFHRTAARGREVSVHARFDRVRQLLRGNLEEAAPLLGRCLSREVFDRLWSLMDAELDRRKALIEERAERDVPCDGHGDLRLEHVYDFPDRPPPRDLVIIDGIEFNESLRCADPVADMAFFYVDLLKEGRPDLASEFASAWFERAGDGGGRPLLPLYSFYRAAVRGKVLGQKSQAGEVPEPARKAARDRSRVFWLLALRQLETPGGQPCLLLTAGLPGSGKSTLVETLAEAEGLNVIRSDAVRKELAGRDPLEPASDAFGEGLYSREWTRRTYGECLKRAEERVFRGGRVVVDASFSEDAPRRAFLEFAERWGIPVAILHCRATKETSLRRLAERRGGVSDADAAVYRGMAGRWEDFGADVSPRVHELDMNGPIDEALEQASSVLVELQVGKDQPAPVEAVRPDRG